MKAGSEHAFQYNAVRMLKAARFIIIDTDVMDALKFITPQGKFGKMDSRRFVYISHHKNMGYTKGQSDLIVGKNGQFWALELKAQKGRQSPEQKQFQAMCEAEGLTYLLVNDYPSLENFINKNKNFKVGGTD